MENIKVNIEQGFLVHWCQEFINRYGNESLFIHSLSDFFTLKVAHMLEDSGKDVDFSKVKIYADEEAFDAINYLRNKCEPLKQPLFKEPLGSEPLGAIENAVDSMFGTGTFNAWLEAFENRNFIKCEQLLKIS